MNDNRRRPVRSGGPRVVVTGGAGFVGHHLVAALVSGGARVLVIDDLSTGRADRLPPDVELERLDIVTGDLGAPMRAWRPSLIYHLAAQASVPASEAFPERDLQVNGVGTLRIVAAARASGVGRIVFTSSGGAVYGDTGTPATERSPARPTSVYGIHKLLAEQYLSRSGIATAIARPSNIYGPGQDARGEGAVVASFIAAARVGGPIVIHGDGSQERDFVHVLDVVAALIALGAESASGIWNVSFGTSTAIVDLASAVERIAGRGLQRQFGPLRAGDVHVSRIRSRALRRLGWAPRIRLEDGLRGLLSGE
ncbi:MAG TPA: NAD-dependent epimerase/dehydratase family protein [Candidatus Limnocylindrales bacterium]